MPFLICVNMQHGPPPNPRQTPAWEKLWVTGEEHSAACSRPPPQRTRGPTHLKDAVAVLGQRCRGVGGVHLRELFGKVADVQLVPDHGLERGGDLLRCQVLPVGFLKPDRLFVMNHLRGVNCFQQTAGSTW